MMQVISALKGFGIVASDGDFGTVADFLFDDSTWDVRWLVVECGTWRKGHKVLIHPSAISSIDFEEECFAVKLTKAEVDGSPDEFEDMPVSRQMQARLYDHYGWDPNWGAPSFVGASGAMASPLSTAPFLGFESPEAASGEEEPPTSDDPHLRSFVDIVGYGIHAKDGEIGHLENFMLDTSSWSLRYLIVDTSHWWFGKRVLLANAAVTEIDWSDRRLAVSVSRDEVKSSPIWDPLVAFDEIYAKRLHHHYGWPGMWA